MNSEYFSLEEVPHSEAEIYSLPLTQSYRAYRWSDGISEVFFSATQQGEALSIHIAAGKNGKFGLRKAVNDFCQTMFDAFEWCSVILGVVGPQSVVNLSKKCGFAVISEFDDETAGHVTVVARERECLL